VCDMNAKIGKENILRSHAGMLSLHENTSENGSRLVNFVYVRNHFLTPKCDVLVVHATNKMGSSSDNWIY
jgi:hypothetical protein